MAFTELASPAAQRAYERACRALFEALDQLEMRLATKRYLFGDRIVESDWRLFCTLIRFDVVYHGHFKCNLRRILDYPNLQGYLTRSLPTARHRRDGEFRSHQAPLLHDAR